MARWRSRSTATTRRKLRVPGKRVEYLLPDDIPTLDDLDDVPDFVESSPRPSAAALALAARRQAAAPPRSNPHAARVIADAERYADWCAAWNDVALVHVAVMKRTATVGLAEALRIVGSYLE
jgi:hypothetical protein